jgi:hypothetical protein
MMIPLIEDDCEIKKEVSKEFLSPQGTEITEGSVFLPIGLRLGEPTPRRGDADGQKKRP